MTVEGVVWMGLRRDGLEGLRGDFGRRGQVGRWAGFEIVAPTGGRIWDRTEVAFWR